MFSKVKILFITAAVSLFLSSSVIYAAPVVSILPGYPGSVIAGDEFNVSFNATGLDPNLQYFMKARGGVGTDLTEMDTWNLLDWHPDSGPKGAWDLMPSFTSDSLGSASATLKVRFDPTTAAGLKNMEIRINKCGSTNCDSSPVTITVITPTPSPTPSPSPTPVPTTGPTSTPTSTPTPVPTATPKKTATPGPTISPTADPNLVPLDNPAPQPDVLGVRDKISLSDSASDSAGLTESGGPPIIPIILIGSGVVFIAVAGLALAKKGKPEYNLKDENTGQTA